MDDARLLAAAGLVAALREAEAGGGNLIAAFVGGDPFVAFRHYPDEDAWDEASRAQFYFHAHDSGTRAVEAGHVHCFHRPGGRHSEAAPHHLVAIALDATGRPAGLFTTNRWVTEEVFLPAPAARDVAARYAPGGGDVASRVVAGVFGLYRDEILDLLDARDAVLAERRRVRPDADPLEDLDLEILSHRAIDLEATLAELRRTLPE